MRKRILLPLLIIISCVTVACSNPDYDKNYEQGYEKGYEQGYYEGYDEGYYDGEEKAFDYFTSCPSDYVDIEELFYDYAIDNEIITLNNMKDELSESDYQKLIDILDEYFEIPIYTETNTLNYQSQITKSYDYGTDFESTWGDLVAANGGELVYETLTPEQQALVNYPYLDKENVYFVPTGSNYHSVDWCYTLENSKEIINCTLQDALNKRLDPCSKCVGE